MFKPFKADAHLVPLFLKCVESIKLFDWRPESESPVEVFSVFINEETRQSVRDARSRINVRVENADVLAEEAFEAVVTCGDEFQVLSNQKWIIAHCISMEDSDLLKLSKELHHVPWIGLALPIYSGPITPSTINPLIRNLRSVLATLSGLRCMQSVIGGGRWKALGLYRTD